MEWKQLGNKKQVKTIKEIKSYQNKTGNEHRDKTLAQLKLIKKGIRGKATQITLNKPKE